MTHHHLRFKLLNGLESNADGLWGHAFIEMMRTRCAHIRGVMSLLSTGGEKW